MPDHNRSRRRDSIYSDFGLIYQDAIALALGIEAHTPTPWLTLAREYGEGAWRVVGSELSAICRDVGNGWMQLVSIEASPESRAQLQRALDNFTRALEAALDDPEWNSGDDNYQPPHVPRIGPNEVVMLYCRKCIQYPCECREYDYARDGSEALGFCPNDGNGLEIQTEDSESTIFAPCPYCKTEWEMLIDGSLVVFEPGSDPFAE